MVLGITGLKAVLRVSKRARRRFSNVRMLHDPAQYTTGAAVGGASGRAQMWRLRPWRCSDLMNADCTIARVSLSRNVGMSGQKPATFWLLISIDSRMSIRRDHCLPIRQKKFLQNPASAGPRPPSPASRKETHPAIDKVFPDTAGHRLLPTLPAAVVKSLGS